MHLRFRQIRYFVEIVDCGSMTRAAEHLKLAPTALSLQIKKLEEQFGVTLLERHARGVTPTRQGRHFYSSARRILRLLNETEHQLSGRDRAVRRYRLGVSPSVLHTLGPRALFPELEGAARSTIDLVEGSPSELLTRLENGDLDFVFGWVGAPNAPVRMVEVAEEAFVFITPRGLALPDDAVSLSAVLSSDLIRVGHRSMSWQLVSQRASEAGLSIPAGRIVESADLARRMLRDGLGTAILPISFVEPEWRAGEVCVSPLQGEPLIRRLSFAWRDPVAVAGMDGAVLAHIESIVAEFHTLTAPHSRPLGSLVAGLSGAGRTTPVAGCVQLDRPEAPAFEATDR